MRVIAGEFRSRPLVAPRGLNTRPTGDRLRETLFNVLGPQVQGARFADLYAGSGAVGIEALSRGAARSVFVETAPGALAALGKNLSTLGLGDRALVSSRPVARALADLAAKQTSRFDIVFLDPPYAAGEDYAATLSFLAESHEILLASEALVIAEHARRDTLPESFGPLRRTRLLPQGDAALSFYAIRTSADSDS